MRDVGGAREGGRCPARGETSPAAGRSRAPSWTPNVLMLRWPAQKRRPSKHAPPPHPPCCAWSPLPAHARRDGRDLVRTMGARCHKARSFPSTRDFRASGTHRSRLARLDPRMRGDARWRGWRGAAVRPSRPRSARHLRMRRLETGSTSGGLSSGVHLRHVRPGRSPRTPDFLMLRWPARKRRPSKHAMTRRWRGLARPARRRGRSSG